MNKYTYTDAPGAFKATLLHDEILAEYPSLSAVGRFESKPDGSEVYISVPDDFDKALLDALIAAHDPNVLRSGEQREARREASRIDMLAENIRHLRNLNAQADTPAKRIAVLDRVIKNQGHILRLLDFDPTINGGE